MLRYWDIKDTGRKEDYEGNHSAQLYYFWYYGNNNLFQDYNREIPTNDDEERHDAFANGDKTPKLETRSYADIMREAAMKREKEETLKVLLIST